jgi:hypothetical protein
VALDTSLSQRNDLKSAARPDRKEVSTAVSVEIPAPCDSRDARAMVATTMRLGQELLAVPREERTLDWYVSAQFIGDLPALGSAIIRAEVISRVI